MTFHEGQRVIARDGAQYVLIGAFEGVWWGVRIGGASLPVPVAPRYPAYGLDDERVGADRAPGAPKELKGVRIARERRGRVRAIRGVAMRGRAKPPA